MCEGVGEPRCVGGGDVWIERMEEGRVAIESVKEVREVGMWAGREVGREGVWGLGGRGCG